MAAAAVLLCVAIPDGARAAESDETIAQLRAENIKLRAQVAQLTARLAELRQAQAASEASLGVRPELLKQAVTISRKQADDGATHLVAGPTKIDAQGALSLSGFKLAIIAAPADAPESYHLQIDTSRTVPGQLSHAEAARIDLPSGALTLPIGDYQVLASHTSGSRSAMKRLDERLRIPIDLEQLRTVAHTHDLSLTLGSLELPLTISHRVLILALLDQAVPATESP